MITLRQFADKLSQMDNTASENAVAFLWFYNQNQIYEERTASELGEDLSENGFAKQNTSRLNRELTKSRLIVKGKRKGTFQLNIRHIPALTEIYAPLVNLRIVNVTPSVIPEELFKNKRTYLVRMVHGINGCYDYGFFDGSAVMLRRLMESLIIEVFLSRGLANSIRVNGVFVTLERLINRLLNEPTITLSRNTPRGISTIKTLGDTAAHDRTYITQQSDIDDHILNIRRTIQELIVLSNI